ncbi:hypothetical protein BJ508DRAFT_304582 [Ascobolus immersus RN42]|uniref:Uncharacterized protein n=1 Tax=Ascobolus immersus RN42 TaxID=1160509 RepID=A0A3N4IC96_ASCIM|nr:hypothetical protein BJ508DRAFT_304582 [Ascobolus immersus RN42]
MVYRPKTFWSWSFLLIALVESLIVLAFEGYVFAKFQNNLVDRDDRIANGVNNDFQYPQERTIPTYLTLFIFGHLFMLFMVYDALRLKNTIQIIGLCLFNVALLIYAAIQKDQIKEADQYLKTEGARALVDKEGVWKAIEPFLIAIPCVLALGTVLLSVVCWKLYDEFAWTIYKHISADLRMKRRYLTFQIFVALLKFDFFFFLGFTVQFLVIVLQTNDIEFKLTIVVIPLTVLFLLAAVWATRRENRILMSGVIVIFLASLAYFLFKLIRMYTDKTRVNDYMPARRSLTSFAVITILLIVVTIVNAVVCTLNFGKGLKPHITKSTIEDGDEKHPMTDMNPHMAQPMSTRMEID